MAEKSIVWECFPDESYYGMWAVRPVDDKDFNSPRLFHFAVQHDAETTKDLLNKCHCANQK